MISDFFAGRGLVLQASGSESLRFGFGVSRLLVPVGEAASDRDIVAVVSGSPSELVIVRADERRTDLIRALRAIDGVECLHADTLMYYQWSLNRFSTSLPTASDVTVTQSKSFDEIAGVLRESFKEYRNHYSANPRLADSVTVTAYEEWASSLMRDGETRTFVARDATDGAVHGFVLLSLDEARQLAEVALNAVHPDAQRSGVYSALMRSAAAYLAQLGSIKHLYISTQRENTAVIAAWQKLGLEPYLTLNTIHVMRRLASLRGDTSATP